MVMSSQTARTPRSPTAKSLPTGKQRATSGVGWVGDSDGSAAVDGAWGLLMGAARSVDAPKGVRKGTLSRVLRFARPHRRLLIMFLILTVASSVLAVTTPLLAGQVVNAIVGGHDTGVVIGLAVLIAGLAVVDAGLGVVERWQSSQIGESLIYDLRRAVFEHVQQMPVAFFTRTRTGALVSRLNNDVIGAQ